MNPRIFLAYQAAWIKDRATLKVCVKSRRIGITWAEAADDVLLAATEGRAGMDVLYISFNLDMTREYIDACAGWAKKYDKVASEIGEFVLMGKRGEEIKAFRIDFPSGHKVLALSGNPANLRGKQGRVVIDEAAFVPDLEELLKAAIALTMWGGHVVVISTHNGVDNEFNALCEDIRAGKRKGSLHLITLDDAIAQGLVRRIFEIAGRDWTPEAETAWRADLYDTYKDTAAEELDCIPSKGTGAYLPMSIIEACMDSKIPVLRWNPPQEGFVDLPDETRYREMRDWLESQVTPVLDRLPKELPSYVGEDFGRISDLSVYWPLLRQDALRLDTPLVMELRDCPFRQQEQALFHLCDRLPRLSGLAMDAGGNGMYLAELARQRYGAGLVEEVKLSESWYREHMPRLKAGLEDRGLTIPKDGPVKDDLRLVRLIRGVPRIPDLRTTDKAAAQKGAKRHGDSAVALALAQFAAATMDAGGPFEVITGGGLTNNIIRGYRDGGTLGF